MIERMNLQMFAEAGSVVNATGGYVNAYSGEKEGFAGANDLSPEMKEFYRTNMLENARANLYFAQFGRMQGLPKNNGMSIEWRKWNTLPMADKLMEAVIPTGKKMGVSVIQSPVEQFGMYVTISDRLETHAVDNMLLGATEELGASASRTQDTLIRNEAIKGTSVLYGRTDSAAAATRYELTKEMRLTPDLVNRAATMLKKNNAPTINGKYVAIIHPSVAYDLRKTQDWIEVHKYAAVEEIFRGEIGELHGVRFVETTQAKIYQGKGLSEDARYLNVAAWTKLSAAGTATAGEGTLYQLTIDEQPEDALVGREINIENTSGELSGTFSVAGINATNKYVYLAEDPTVLVTPADGMYLVPGEGGKETHDGGQVAVYATLVMGKEAYGIIDPEGAGLEMIIKNRDTAGGPLNQFSTAGYKLETGTKILYNDRMVRIETCSEYSDVDEAN